MESTPSQPNSKDAPKADNSSADFYKRLGIDANATPKDIKQAMRGEAKKFHPDLHQQDTPEAKAQAEERFKRLNEAYEALSDPQKRLAYDRQQAQQEQATAQAYENMRQKNTSHPESPPFTQDQADFSRAGANSFSQEQRENMKSKASAAAAAAEEKHGRMSDEERIVFTNVVYAREVIDNIPDNPSLRHLLTAAQEKDPANPEAATIILLLMAATLAAEAFVYAGIDDNESGTDALVQSTIMATFALIMAGKIVSEAHIKSKFKDTQTKIAKRQASTPKAASSSWTQTPKPKTATITPPAQPAQIDSTAPTPPPIENPNSTPAQIEAPSIPLPPDWEAGIKQKLKQNSQFVSTPAETK